ncbi:acyl-CoA ligase (AMP-forming), exosortase A system-associated [Thermodesulfobacteriota bacterium]
MSLKPFIVPHLIEDAAIESPDKIAIEHKERTVTYSELFDESSRMNWYLKSMRLRKGERVAILLDKSIEQLVGMFGISMAGGIFVFINTILKKTQIEYILNDCQVNILLTTQRHFQKNNLDFKGIVVFMDEEHIQGDIPCWSKLRKDSAPDGGIVDQIADDTACLIYTSGSTGFPKGVVVPHRTVVEGAEIISSYLGIKSDDRLISVLPFNFDYGLNQATSSILKKATMVMHQFFLPKDLLTILEEKKITGFAGMVPIWIKLFNEKYETTSDSNFPNLRYISNTGGKVPRPIVEKMRVFFPKTKIFLMYGLTEAFRSTYLPPEELDKRPDSIGKAIPNVEILVVNKNGEECAPDEPGELVHRGALVTKGYWNDEDKTKKVFRKNPLLNKNDQPHLEDIAVFSGDLVKKDEDGFIYFISRRDEMIKTSGYRVSPTEIEEGLIEIPEVSNAVVFGKEGSEGDQIIIAVVESRDTKISEKTLFQVCRKKLPGYMVPHEIHIEKSFKLTANGKVDRSFIKQKWMNQESFK